MTETLADALPAEIERVTLTAGLYMSVPGGQFAAAMMLADVRAAQQAIMRGDVVEMVRIYQELKEWKE